MSATPSRRRVHYVLSSHWDREWHQPFQHFRYRLVQMLDRVIDGLESGRLQGPFTLDGQAIVIEDYLEVRPQQRAKVEQFLREGKLIAGPWYDLPDEFLVSGESLVRNIQLGRRLVREWGAEPSNAGWVCDIFGHNSQLPQILRLFGIRAGFLWRGVNDLRATQLWRGADGTEILCHRFGADGYCDYAAKVRGLTKSGPAPIGPAAEAAAGELLDKYLKDESERTPVGPLLVFDGADHQEWDETVYRVLMERAARPDYEFEIVHSTLDAYLSELEAEAESIIAVVEGELREPASHPMGVDNQWLIPGVLSSRVNLKQENAWCQTSLTALAEPLATVAHHAVGTEYPEGFLNVAWKWLLQNHPHDSICGCSIDQVHRDMLYCFSQSRQISEQLTKSATYTLAAAIEGELTDGELRCVVFNPQPRDFDGVTEVTLNLPAEWPIFQEFFGFEAKASFRIFDASGTEVPFQRLAENGIRKQKFSDTVRFPQAWQAREVKMALQLAVPALGYTSLTVRKAEGEYPRHPAVPGLYTRENQLENEWIKIQVQPNGSLTLTDKRNDAVYEKLLTFEDVADIGDGWFHGPAVNDQQVVSSAATADVALLYNGPLEAALRIRTHFRVPHEFNFATGTRSEQWVNLTADSKLIIRADSDAVEVETTINNVACDHRVRVLFPSHAQTDTYLSDTPFDVVERPIALRADNHLYRELEVETKPQTSWSAVFDAERGLAVINDGSLLECAILDNKTRTLALTLFRSTRNTVFTDGEPDGQMLGTLKFRYAIVPLQGSPDAPALFDYAAWLAAGVPVAQLRPEDRQFVRRDFTNPSGNPNTRPLPSLPASAGFLKLDGPAVLSAVQSVGNAIEVRLFNPHSYEISVSLTLDKTLCPRLPDSAAKVDFEGAVLEELTIASPGVCSVTLGAKEIVTVRLG